MEGAAYSPIQNEIDLLTDIRDGQLKHEQIITELKNQNAELVKIIRGITENEYGEPDDWVYAKVEGFYMPFWSLVGFLVKLSIASIPAAFILIIFWIAIYLLIRLIGLLPPVFLQLSNLLF
jgi:hypothetical protein